VRLVASDGAGLVRSLRSGHTSFVTLPGDAGGVSALLPLRLRDPDGHVLELVNP